MAVAQVLDLVRPEPRVETVLTNLKISGFRTFRELTIPQLARVNLFVGTNDAGKTSILEAVELVAEGTLSALVLSIARRDEPDPQLDASHLFHGHRLGIGELFQIRETGPGGAWAECEVIETPGQQETIPPSLGLRFTSHLAPKERILRLTFQGGITVSQVFMPIADRRVKFVTTGGISPQLHQLWDEVVLTPEEASVIAALRIINPRIERVAPSGRATEDSGTFLVKLAGLEPRLPLGSLGDGIKRLLALALHLVSARGGVLLVDEIDTGLHHTVMADMWRLVIETACRLDVQVFATTHSLDCVHALAWVHQQDPTASSEVLLHRVERDAPETVAYTLDELAVAARNHLEVR